MTSKKAVPTRRKDNIRRSLETAINNGKIHKDAAPLVLDILDQNSEMGFTIRDFENARSIDPRRVRSVIMGLSESEPDIPDWVTASKPSNNAPGTPMLFASDWHWGEVVRKAEMGGVNEFNLSIAHKRARLLIERTIDLCFNHMVNPKYPGIVFVLGGDMVSGDIHEELRESNELPTLPTLVDLLGVLAWCIQTLADKFGRVFVPAVAGNHGRTTRKPRFKFRAETNYDWLLYTLLEKQFASDSRVKFFVPSGPDALFTVHNTRFLLNHGDQFRGGDGQVGALGPVLRGDHRKRTKATQVNNEYDIMIIGHWHTYSHLGRVIINGSLKGYDEYANGNNFPFESAAQALWIVHPKHGVTFRMPVILQDNNSKSNTAWVSWK